MPADTIARTTMIKDLTKNKEISRALGQIIVRAQTYPSGNPDAIDVALFLHVAAMQPTQGESKTALRHLLRGKSVPLAEGLASQAKRSLVTPALALAFDDAFDIRKRTGGQDTYIGLRHVLFSIFTSDRSPLVDETNHLLDELSIDRLAAGRALRDYCISFMEEQEEKQVWDQIFLERGLDDADQSNLVALIGADDPLKKGAKDRSGSQAEADAFAAMITARQFVPPLAIGVFGEWGSGKSFFMRLVYDTIESRRLGTGTAKAASDVSLLDNVVQIRFNAWHYAETNLWASLVDNIFTHLDRWAEKANQQGRTDKVFNRLATARKLTIESAENLVAARKDRDTAETRLKYATEQLSNAKKEYAKKPEAWVKAAYSALLPQTKDKVSLENAVKLLGLGPVTEKASNLYDAGIALDSAVGSFGIIRSGVLRYLSLPLVVIGVSILTIALPPLFAYFASVGARFLEVYVSPVAAAVSGALAPVVAAVGLAANRTKAAADKVRKFHDDFKKKVDELAKGDVTAAETAQKTLEVAASKVKEAEDRLKIATAEVALAADEYNLKSGKGRAIRFVRARVASGDYAKHLGFIATVRKDFDELSVLMSPSEDVATSTKATKAQQMHVDNLIEAAGTHLNEDEKTKLKESVAGLTDDLQVFERIVLYIDDLDRCPPQQVVEVLQAVNMLLAFPLFVVLVAVDVRWLRNSLVKNYPGQLQDETEATATPGDYLEKIFQIPYWVRPMTADNTGSLLDDHLGSEEKAQLSEEQTDAQESSQAQQAHESERSDTVGGERDEVPNSPERVMTSLRVTGQERKFMKELAVLLDHSPRRTLRFVNSYRLIKASFTKREVVDLESGGFKVLLALLASATCAGEPGSQLLSELSGGLSSSPQPQQNSTTANAKRVAEARKLMNEAGVSSEDIKKYAAVAARFSFERHWAATL
ncbi:hypothetical protein J2W92_000731 [Rhizobium leguminosarum]